MVARPRTASQSSNVKKASSSGSIVVSRSVHNGASTGSSRAPATLEAAGSQKTTRSAQSTSMTSSKSSKASGFMSLGASNTNTSVKSLKVSGDRSSSASASTDVKPVLVATKRIPSSKSNPPVTANATSKKVPTVTPSIGDETLQLAAQTQSWQCMCSTLKSGAQRAKHAAETALKAREEELLNEEADIADARVRFETERVLGLYEELLDPEISSTLPGLVQRFLRLEDRCAEITATSLRISSRPLDEHDDVTIFNAILDTTETLTQEADKLEKLLLSTLELLCKRSEEERVATALRALLPVVRARIANLTSTRTLVWICKDTVRMVVHTKSLQLY